MNTKTYISESDRAGELEVSVIPDHSLPSCLSLEVADPISGNGATITVFTYSMVGFLELLRKVTDECLLRVKDKESKGERDDA